MTNVPCKLRHYCARVCFPVALTSQASGGRSVGVVRYRTKATEFMDFLENRCPRVARVNPIAAQETPRHVDLLTCILDLERLLSMTDYLKYCPSLFNPSVATEAHIHLSMYAYSHMWKQIYVFIQTHINTYIHTYIIHTLICAYRNKRNPTKYF
jgi:hypothetical protein